MSEDFEMKKAIYEQMMIEENATLFCIIATISMITLFLYPHKFFSQLLPIFIVYFFIKFIIKIVKSFKKENKNETIK